jgi:signal transduction histidine kinase
VTWHRQRAEWFWAVVLGLVALIVPILAGAIVFDQSRRPMLGMTVDAGDPSRVTAIMIGSAAADAGLRYGDAVVAVDGLPYSAWQLADARLGQTYTFDLIREGRPWTLPVTMESMLEAHTGDVFSAVLVALIFWGTALLLLRRRFRQMDVRLLSLFYQACAVVLLVGLAYPRFWLPPPRMISIAVASFILAAPLLLHYQLTFPVVLGSASQRWWVLAPLYGLALAGAAEAWRRPAPWRSPAGPAALLVGACAIGIALFVYFRRASVDSRRRLRVAFAGAIVGLALPMAVYVLPTVVMGYSPAVPRWAVSLSLAVIPLSYLYTAGRQNLFGVDQLLNRASVYVVLSAGIVALYLGALLLLYQFIPNRWLLHVAVATGLTLVTALTFQPLRARVQRWVDRLFYAGWYDYPRVVDQATAKLARSREWADLVDILTREIPVQMHLRGARLAVGERSASTLEPYIKPGLEIPLDCGGQACGSWTVGPRRDGVNLNPEDRRILHTLAREAEIALSNVLLLETLRAQLDEIRASREALVQLQHQLLRSREEARGRLARDLHDGPIQALVGMSMRLGMLAPAAGDGSPIADALQGMRAEVRELLDELRQVCTELRPPTLDTLGLGAALRVLAGDWSAEHGVALQLDLPPDAALRALPEEVAVNLYRVAQEALSNIARHARAQCVDLRLAWDAAGCLELAIRDDGCGFAPAAVEELAAQGHFGLAGIRERAALIGGQWRLESAPGRGTAVSVTWRRDGAGKPF